MKDFFRNLFGQDGKPQNLKNQASVVPQNGPAAVEGEFLKKGDVIGGQYEIYGVIGKGGFGVVYFAYQLQTQEIFALKTFRDELLADIAGRESFKKEALLWVNLEEHPCILAARMVSEFYGRLFVAMDYIAPDAYGRVTLSDHLAGAGGPLSLEWTLRWAIQFCHGMEHANSCGLNCHRDIKPANILITKDGQLKISDFGLATAAEVAWRGAGARGISLIRSGIDGGFGLSLMQIEGQACCGTPGYIAPEVYRGEWADIRSDLYSFGLVMWQMATGSRVPPFMVGYDGDFGAFLRGIYLQQMNGSKPRMESLLEPVINRCLCSKPSARYGSFGELRAALEPLLNSKTSWDGITTPTLNGKTAEFWNNKGGSLAALGRHEEAVDCYEKALAIDPDDVITLSNKGVALSALGLHNKAIVCYDRAVAIDPGSAMAWNNKGSSLIDLEQYEESLECFDIVLKIDPRNATALSNKGRSLGVLGRHQQALICYDAALAADWRYGTAWNGKGGALTALGKSQEALTCFDQALTIDPRNAAAWNNKGSTLSDLGRHQEALTCYDQALKIEPSHSRAWNNKANALGALRRFREAVKCCDHALAADPGYANAWYNKGVWLTDLPDQYEGALRCYEKALAIDPREAKTWCNKASLEEALGRMREAASSYRQFIELAPPAYRQQVAYAQERLKALEGR